MWAMRLTPNSCVPCAITGIIFILAQVGLAWVIFRYRSRGRGQRASHFEGNAGMEIIWTLATLILFVGLGLYGEDAWAEAHFQGPRPGAPNGAYRQQFAWNFRYPGRTASGAASGPNS